MRYQVAVINQKGLNCPPLPTSAFHVKCARKTAASSLTVSSTSAFLVRGFKVSKQRRLMVDWWNLERLVEWSIVAYCIDPEHLSIGLIVQQLVMSPG